MTTAHFTKLQLHEKLLEGIVEAGFSHCLPVQEETYAYTFKGRDVYVQSQTGSGKTAAFLISIFHLLLHDKKFSNKAALIIAPTRELAIQIESEAKLLGRYLDFTIGCLYGGVGYAKQERLLAQNAHIIIGTPGRLLDFYHQGKLHFQDIGILVIDEADRMFDMGFLPDVRRMVKKMPPPSRRITMMFSATLDYRVRELAWEYMDTPVEIEIKPEQVTVENITQEIHHVAKEDKMSLLLGILKQEQPGNALIFTNTKHAAVEVANRLECNGYTCEFIIGDLPQSRRTRIIEKIKSGKIRYLVATDVAARGLHINDLEMVVNYDLPQESEYYVHRIGRTARVGKHGKAVTLACDQYVYSLEAIEKYIKMKIPVAYADEELFFKDESIGKSFAGKRNALKESRRKGPRQQQTVRSVSAQKGSFAKKSAPRKTVSRTKPGGTTAKPRKNVIKRFDQKRRAPKPATHEGRLDYYRKKYGEDFKQPSESSFAEQPVLPHAPARSRSIFRKILGFVTGKT